MTTRTLTYGHVTLSPRYYSFSAIGADGKYDINGNLNENPYRITLNDRVWFKKLQTSAKNTSGLPGRMAHLVKKDELTFKVQSKIPPAVKGHKFHAGKFLGEGKQTYAMTVQAMYDISRAMREVKRGNFRTAAKVLTGSFRHRPRRGYKGYADRWLELQYGWKPLYSDVYEAWKAWSVYQDSARQTRLHVRVKDRDTMLNVVNDYYDVMIQYEGKASVVIVLKEQLSTPRALGLIDPVGVLWEIMPWSFMIDWFIPIGTYLENLNVIPNINGRMFIMTKREYMNNIKWKKFSVPLGHLGDHQYTHLLNLDRLEMPPIAVFPQFVRLPDVMSPIRFFNALALATQRIK